MKRQDRPTEDEICDDMQIEDIQANEITNSEKSQVDSRADASKIVTEEGKKISVETKQLTICTWFATWPKLFFGE